MRPVIVWQGHDYDGRWRKYYTVKQGSKLSVIIASEQVQVWCGKRTMKQPDGHASMVGRRKPTLLLGLQLTLLTITTLVATTALNFIHCGGRVRHALCTFRAAATASRHRPLPARVISLTVRQALLFAGPRLQSPVCNVGTDNHVPAPLHEGMHGTYILISWPCQYRVSVLQLANLLESCAS